MKVAVFSTQSYDKNYLERYNKNYSHQITYFDVQLNSQTAYLTKSYESVCVFVNDKLDKNTIDILKQNGIKLIALRCAGFNNINLESAKSNDIKVVRVPAYSPQAVAEHTIALILTLNRKTHRAYNRVRENNFSLDNLMGFNLYKKTIGVVGTGKIGTSLCNILLGFSCNIIAFDPLPNEDLISKGVKYVTFENLLINSDIVTLHCPLTESTKHIIDKQSLTLMKDTAMLINTSRGGLINTKDVISALKSNQLAYLGLDVYEQEEGIFFKDLSGTILHDDLIARLMTFPNVLITSHQAFFTHEAMEEISITTLDNISQFENNLPLTNEILI